MKKLFLLLLLILLTVSCSFDKTVTIDLCAHRGFHDSQHPENSLFAFTNAIDYGCKEVELDIHKTIDNNMVVTHDKILKRVYGVDINVEENSLEEIYKQVTKEQVPTLEDVWEICEGKVNMQIEIKDSNAKDLLLDFFDKNSCYDSCIVISFNKETLSYIKSKNNKIKCGYLIEKAFDKKVLDYSWADIIACEYSIVNKKIVNQIHNAKKQAYVWTVNSVFDMFRMQNMGVDKITTNNPTLSSSY